MAKKEIRFPVPETNAFVTQEQLNIAIDELRRLVRRSPLAFYQLNLDVIRDNVLLQDVAVFGNDPVELKTGSTDIHESGRAGGFQVDLLTRMWPSKLYDQKLGESGQGNTNLFDASTEEFKEKMDSIRARVLTGEITAAQALEELAQANDKYHIELTNCFTNWKPKEVYTGHPKPPFPEKRIVAEDPKPT